MIRRLRRGRLLLHTCSSQHGEPTLGARCADSLVHDAQEAKDIGDEFLALEKFVNLNYLVRICRCLQAPRRDCDIAGGCGKHLPVAYGLCVR